MASLPNSMSSSFESGNLLDFPPSELLVKPMPCVALTGLEPSQNTVHKTISDILMTDRKSDRLPISYIVRPINHEYPRAKPKKTSYEWYMPRGILKTHWMRKHLYEVPSVVVIFYNLDWVADPNWREKQAECQNLVRAVQSNFGGRSTKIVLVVIQEGASLPPGGDAISEERCASLCNACGLQLQNSLFILQNNEQLHGCCIKLEARLFELAQNYYVMETRKVKDHREFLNKTTHQLLFVRHHFKTGFLSEFVRPPDGIQSALRNYRQAFGHLMDVRATDYNLFEIKVMAGFISYKIWALSLMPGSNASQRDAELHFRKHVDWLRLRIGQPELEFEHFAWLASQYRLYADLFADAIRGAGFTASISQHPGIYYHQAAILTRERRRAIISAPTPQLPKAGTILANGAVILEGQLPQLVLPSTDASNEFYGQRAWRPGYQSLEPPDLVTEAVGIIGLQNVERNVNHSLMVTQLLSSAGIHFRKMGSTRMCTRLSWETANELTYTFEKNPSNASVALSLLRTVVSEYRSDRWTDLLKVALLRQLECPRVFGESNDDVFDSDYEQELASICFELAAIPGSHQRSTLNAIVALVSQKELPSAEPLLFAKSLLQAWSNHVKNSNDRVLCLDVSVLGNSSGLIQAWASFPLYAATLDRIPVVRLSLRLADLESVAEGHTFQVESAGVGLHFHYYSKSKTGNIAAPMTRTTTKMMDVEAENAGGVWPLLRCGDVNEILCTISRGEANALVSAAVSANSGSEDVPTFAFVAISSWWVEVEVDSIGKLRLNWVIGDEPLPEPIQPSTLTGRELIKRRQRNSSPKWLTSARSKGSELSSFSVQSPYICCLKPRHAHVTMSIDQDTSPALVGERYPVILKIQNTNAEVATTEMVLSVEVASSNTQGSVLCLLPADITPASKLSDHLVVAIPSIGPAAQLSVKGFFIHHFTPDVLSLSLQLRCNSIPSVDDAIFEVVRYSFSIPVVVPISLATQNLLDYDTLAPVSVYCPSRRNIISLKCSISSPHDLELRSMRIDSSEVQCAALDSQWPRILQPGTSFVEAFDIPSLLSATLQSPTVSLGKLVLQWKRHSSTENDLVETVMQLPEFPVQIKLIIVRTVDVPSRAELFKPCEISFTIQNVSNTTLSLRATIQVPPVVGNNSASTSMIVSGSSDITITLLSGISVVLPVSFIPLIAGFVSLPRLKISAATVTSSGVSEPIGLGAGEYSDFSSSSCGLFVQTSPNIEWLLPSSVHSTI